MKKVIIPFLSTLAFIGFSTASASNFPVTVINNTDSTMTIQYTVCSKANNNICTLVKEHKLGSLTSGSNRLRIVGELKPSSDGVTIGSAIAVNGHGNQVARLNQPCDLPSNQNAIILESNNSNIVCKYGNTI